MPPIDRNAPEPSSFVVCPSLGPGPRKRFTVRIEPRSCGGETRGCGLKEGYYAKSVDECDFAWRSGDIAMGGLRSDAMKEPDIDSNTIFVVGIGGIFDGVVALVLIFGSGNGRSGTKTTESGPRKGIYNFSSCHRLVSSGQFAWCIAAVVVFDMK
ncbi:hypothetical protein P171DRAFT_264976 [Karstenula rhodostoma CBS 690.94]|uniref:Uncharacterized protein n=1 Tax=Karstenula rhodostoma CBS 690.94 TaxID=1392251 RepID=A0A9P4UDH5_9PLEO|nr:hypothetical protein P171DRAFT_264976 [Karstenula rhodostoma CBS 690.94]